GQAVGDVARRHRVLHDAGAAGAVRAVAKLPWIVFGGRAVGVNAVGRIAKKPPPRRRPGPIYRLFGRLRNGPRPSSGWANPDQGLPSWRRRCAPAFAGASFSALRITL